MSFVPHLTDPDHGPVRETVFTELFRGARPDEAGVAAIRDARYKVLREYRRSGRPRDQFFDLEQDPFEQTDLTRAELTAEQQKRYEALCAEIDRLRASGPKANK